MKTVSVFYCLLYVAGIEGAAINVEGLEGGEVSFQCSHRLAWKNAKYLCKDPCEDALVTVQPDGRAASGRISLVDSGDGVFTVTFSHLQRSDLGRYWCAVDRLGFDTFIAVLLTVKEAAANETTTVVPELSPTWAYQNMTSSTQFTFTGMDTSKPANHSTASNTTSGGEQDSVAGTVLYATVGAVAALTIVMLAVIVTRRRGKSKHRGQARFHGTDRVGAEEGEANCDNKEIGAQSITTNSERFSVPQHPKQDPPTSASTAAERNVPLQIYENVRRPKGTAHSRHSANVPDEHDISSRIYINPLPPISERTGEGRKTYK